MNDAAASTNPHLRAPAQATSLGTAAGLVVVVAALYLGREIFLPLALAVLLAFALAPVVDWLRRFRVPRLPAVAVAVTFGFVVIAGVSLVVGAQLIQLANNLPNYQQTIQEKVRSLQASAPGGGMLDRLTSTVRDLKKELSQADQSEPEVRARSGNQPVREPIPVTIETPALKPLEVIITAFRPLLAPLLTAGIVIVLVIFVLLEREDMRDRFIRLMGAGDLQKSTEALNEAARRVSRYLLMQLLVNVTYGIPIAAALYFIGVPNAVLWGILAAVLRFIPYVGPFLAAMFPLLLAFAVDPGWSMLLWTLALFLLMEAVSNNVVEPWLYGSSTGLSALAIIIAAIFWTVLWGPAGLVLSTPLTVCLVVMGRYVPQLSFLGVLLGNEPVLAPEERLYQRLLSGNVEEAVELAEGHTQEQSPRAFYDEVAIPALRLAENDRQRGAENLGYRRTVADTLMAVLQEVSEDLHEPGEAVATDPRDHSSVLCIGGRTELDQTAAEMLTQVLGEVGVKAQALPPVAINREAINQLNLDDIDAVCLCYLNPQPQAHAKYTARRLKRRAPGLKIIACLLNGSADPVQADELASQMSVDGLAFALEDAVRQVAAVVKQNTPGESEVAPIPADEEDRLRALRDLRLPTTGSSQFDEFAARVAAAFDMPISLISLIDEEHQRWPGAVGLPDDLDACRTGARSTSICSHVVAKGDIMIIKDVAKDSRFAKNPFLLEKGIRFYAGAPLRTSSGLVLGSLCVIDTKPRSFSAKDRKLLQIIADDLMAKIELQSKQQGDNRSEVDVDQIPAAPVEELRHTAS